MIYLVILEFYVCLPQKWSKTYQSVENASTVRMTDGMVIICTKCANAMTR